MRTATRYFSAPRYGDRLERKPSPRCCLVRDRGRCPRAQFPDHYPVLRGCVLPGLRRATNDEHVSAIPTRMATSSDDVGYLDRVKRLLHRWDARGVLISDARGLAAVEKLRNPAHEKPADLADAQWVCDMAVHPVLQQPIPSAFRVSSFAPITAAISLGMISTKSTFATVIYHWMYQSHSAATRYCNYADTSRPLDAKRMVNAYAASTGAACALTLASAALVTRAPSLRAVGMVVPHAAVAAAGVISTVMNAEVELREGVPVIDAAGAERGVSCGAARATVERAVLLHSVIIPGCALLVPVLAMRTVVVPRLMHTTPELLWPSAAALVATGVGVLTPAAAACVPPTVRVDTAALEPELSGLRDDDGHPLPLWSGKPLY